MVLKTARFISLLLTALATGVAFCHVLEISGKVTLSAPVYLNVQQVLYQDFGEVMAFVEPLALLTTLAVLFLVRQRRLVFFLTLAGVIGLAAELMVWAAFINPINMQVNSWTAESLPANWMEFRDRWEYFHATRAVLLGVGLSVLIFAVLVDMSPTSQASDG